MSSTTALVWLFLAGLVPITVLAIAVYRATAAFPERRLQFEISLLIQLLGSIVFAAIVTYSIYIIEHAQQVEERRIEAQQIAADNKVRVLHFIKDELSYDLTSLKARTGDISMIQQQPLRSDFWRIAGLSGDLKWIDNIDTLNSIAKAYFNIDQVVSWEARYLDATMGMTSTIRMTINNGPQIPLNQYVLSLMSPSYLSAQTAVADALQKL
jgi:hypothetical protein